MIDELSEIRPFLISEQELIRKAETFAVEIFPPKSHDPYVWSYDFDRVYNEVIYPNYGISIVDDFDLGFHQDGRKLFGRFDPLSNTAFVDKSLKDDPRLIFTLWHEVAGHGILQGDWLRAELARLGVNSSIGTTEQSISDKAETLIERQANKFASHAAAPTRLLFRSVQEQFSLDRPFRYIGPGKYSFSIPSGKWINVRCDSYLELCRFIARQVQFQFGRLSIQALSYRVGQLPIIVDETKPRILSLHRVAPRSHRRAAVLAS